MPNAVLNYDKHVEHIIPFSYKIKRVKSAKDMKAIDIDRLGNITIIYAKANMLRGDAPVTDAFVKKNRLDYALYPNEDEYNKIISATKIILDTEAYNSMCDKREKKYMNSLLHSIYDEK